MRNTTMIAYVFNPLRQGHLLIIVPNFAVNLTTMAKPTVNFSDTFYKENT